MIKIAVASGKGGTGKTTIAAHTAHYLAKKHQNIEYIDCDVEEPNGHFFLKPKWNQESPVFSDNPEINKEICTGCGKCAEICQFNAIICLNKNAMAFSELCHSCGGCSLVCPVQAITYKKNQIGTIHCGKSGNIDFYQGLLQIGKAMSPPLIRELKKKSKNISYSIFDCPPGASCPAVESIRDSDYVILVTEPTPFGLNDLKISIDMVRELKVPFGIFINRFDLGNNETEEYCQKENIPIIGRIPNDRKIAYLYSKGSLFTEEIPDYKNVFAQMMKQIENFLITQQPTEYKE